MPFPADYHMHTPLCRHATGEPVEYARQAVALGLPEIGFSDHNPMPEDEFDDWRMRAAQLDEYVTKVTGARGQFPRLNIKLGLEVDYLPGAEDWVRDLANRYPWDYLIGSVHYVSRTWAIDNPAQVSEWRQHEPLEVWKRYFERLTQATASGLFDIIGHVDLCKKFCFYPAGDRAGLAREFLQEASARGVAIELNTAGLRKDCHEIYPSLEILRMAAGLGVPITFGSDAHAPEEVGLNFRQAVQVARRAGYRSYCRFTRRRKEICEL